MIVVRGWVVGDRRRERGRGMMRVMMRMRMGVMKEMAVRADR